MRYFILLSVILLGFFSCKKERADFSLKGELLNLPGDTLYIYGFDEFYDRIDTIIAEQGKFTYSTTLDTLSSLILYVEGTNTEFAVYAERGDRISIKGDILYPYQVKIKGGKYNEEPHSFYIAVDTLSQQWVTVLRERDTLLAQQDSVLLELDSLSPGNDSILLIRDSLMLVRDSFLTDIKSLLLERDSFFAIKAEEYIITHPFSYFSIYLIDKYFVQVNQPDYEKIRELVNSLGGELHDNLYIDQLLKELDVTGKIKVGNRIPQFSLKDFQDETYSVQSFRDKYWIMNFWAPWDSISASRNEDYKRIYNKYKKRKDFEIVSLALDLNKDSIESIIKRDTLSWIHTIVPDLWKGTVVENYGVQKLPYNLLMDKQGRVIDHDMSIDALTQHLDSLFK